MINQLSSYKKLKNLFEQYPDLDYDKFSYYIGIYNTKQDISEEEALKLMIICDNCCSDSIHPVSLASELTNAVYYEHYISLEDLENVPSSDIRDMFFESKMSCLENYKSKVLIEKNEKEGEIEYGK